jgi:hypothetical protein
MFSLKKHFDNLPWFLYDRIREAELAHDRGIDCREKGEFAEGMRHFQRVLDLLSGLGPVSTKFSLRRYSLVAAAHNYHGMIGLDQDHCTAACPAFDRAIALRRELLGLFPAERPNQIYLGGALCNRGHATADDDPQSAAGYYQESLRVLRQPMNSCECGYWDEERQSWWCEQLEAISQMDARLKWVELAPRFIDNAMAGLRSLQPPSAAE